MEGIHMLKDLLRKGDFMVKIDLKDAYFRVASLAEPPKVSEVSHSYSHSHSHFSWTIL